MMMVMMLMVMVMTMMMKNVALLPLRLWTQA